MEAITPPPNAIASSSGLTWIDANGVIIAQAYPHELHTLEHALENQRVNEMLAGGIRRPFLIDMTKVKSMSKEARAFYAGPEPAKILKAVALLTKSNFGRLVANFFISLTTPSIPTRMFLSYAEAYEWLAQFND
jgi:hypothetical protein